MTAYTFTIRLRETSTVAGQALICAEARYASVQWQGQPRADRRFLEPHDWKAIQLELDKGLPSAPLDAESVIAGVLMHYSIRPRYLIHSLAQEPFDETPDRVVLALDQRLRVLQV